MFNFIISRFLDGFLIIIPFAISITIIKFAFNIFSKWIFPIHILFLNKFSNYFYSEFIILFLTLFLTGFIFNFLNLDRLYKFFEEKILKKIPIFKILYFGIKKILKMIFKKENKNNSELVAWVKLPYRNIYCLGLMTTKLDQKFSPEKDKQFFCFFIPTTPNPITGYYIIVEENDCVFTNLTREEAISMIISGGIIKPEN